ncbi:MAG: glycerophosphodiester phosphodiesterase [Ethanoligenens sp.]
MLALNTQVIAHRGFSYQAPENTLEAFSLAVELGADGIELDVHLSKDGQIVVIHDDTVDRTGNGTGVVNEMLFDDLRTLDVSMGRADYIGARIPTLEEVYRLLAPTSLSINVEIKEYRYQDGFVIIPKVLELEKQYQLSDRVFYSSFNHYVLREMKQRQPQAATAALYAAGLVDVWEYTKRIPSDAIHPHFFSLRDPLLVSRCHANGIAVRPWTIDQPDDMKQMFASGADAIITNRPDLALELRE